MRQRRIDKSSLNNFSDLLVGDAEVPREGFGRVQIDTLASGCIGCFGQRLGRRFETV